MAEENGEKSQDATQHRREEAREKGQVAQSQDLSSALVLLGALAILLYTGGGMADFLGRLTARQLGGDAWMPGEADLNFVMKHWVSTARGLGNAFLPALGMMMIVAVLAHFVQIGWLFLPHKAAPDLSRIDPLAGLGRIFSLPNLVRLAFGILKLAIVGAVACVCLLQRRDEILSLTGLDLAQIGLYAWETNVWTAIKIGLALLILAILDYGFQRWRFEQDLKMTPQEVREEMRNLQGDPQVIARRKSVQRQMAMNRMSKAIPKADVVITNPTELAVAIQYDPQTMNAPIVTAKGAGAVAQRIRRLALENGIPIVERKPLAQALYKEVELNQPIPESLFAGVAEVLAYVYQLKGKRPVLPTMSA